MRLEHIEIAGFKSFAKKAILSFETPVTAVVGPNGSGKSNVVEAFRFVLGEQSMKSMRGKSGADLLFRGSNGASRLSRASVSITFDNRDKVFAFQAGESKSPVLFEKVTFSRELFADGTSRYLMNGTEIKLKQMVELLASVNIGTSSHHLISQGEADGILRASPRDRREMLEDALGLKVYHLRIKESESKLTRAAQTLKEVQSLRRELAPHLNFLKKQVEKVEKGQAIRTELEGALRTYIATERAHLQKEDSRLKDAEQFILSKKKDLEETLTTLPETEMLVDKSASERAALASVLQEMREKRRSVEARMSRIEGILEAHRTMAQQQPKHPQSTIAVSFGQTEYHQLVSDLEFFLSTLRDATTIDEARQALAQIEPIISGLKMREPKNMEQPLGKTAPAIDTRDIVADLEALEKDLKILLQKEAETQEQLQLLEAKRETLLAGSQEATKQRYGVIGAIKECEAELQILAVSKGSFFERKENFDAEIKEAGFLFGPSFLRALESTGGMAELDLHDLKRSIDRLKIRLDEHSGIGGDVLNEYESAKERDSFLARELADVEGSIRNLEVLIMDLKKILDEKFTAGVKVINERFGEFFKTMFGGGSAFLSITIEKKRKKKSDEEEIEEETDEAEERFMERGIEVHVNLPEKKVKELTMLSGGERSLVSIALLFAISQVNPPPFLVLDETDAALDEANSRKYGDMIERLAEYSQLIVVTHNRETMSRASVLYGVTLGSDGASKLLSIKFDEAVKVAK